MLKVVAFIPARSGSKRVTHKNIRVLAGHPLIAYTISAALKSAVFSEVLVSTDSQQYAEIATYYGATVLRLRPSEIAGELSPDIEWVTALLQDSLDAGIDFEAFSILRPTSPFRLPETIQRAWDQFKDAIGVDSLRAVEKCKQHPGKMWVVRGDRMTPLLPLTPEAQPWHSSQYQALPEVFVQNASLEIAWRKIVEQTNTIAGNVVMPFFTQHSEGYDVNSEQDCFFAEHMVAENRAILPTIELEPYVR